VTEATSAAESRANTTFHRTETVFETVVETFAKSALAKTTASPQKMGNPPDVAVVATP
jgi:hypothetical protein